MRVVLTEKPGDGVVIQRDGTLFGYRDFLAPYVIYVSCKTEPLSEKEKGVLYLKGPDGRKWEYPAAHVVYMLRGIRIRNMDTNVEVTGDNPEYPFYELLRQEILRKEV